MELRETIDTLRTKNEEAQAVIHGALNNPENMKGLEISQEFSLFLLCLSARLACVSVHFPFLTSRFFVVFF